ncbi:uncharacterized protein LOC134239339 [Saccostrea cucullata]|uniref:uncharacterized protein LOC134239339 n=1 Tax=Saccostrea cuccullata TaxID=36930 RepID=UPI002ED0183E
MVCVCREKLNKILRYEENIMTEEIDNDENGIMISRPGDRINFVSENNNGDICVSDGNVNIVIVVDKKRRVRFRYDGTPARKEKKFSPRHIVTDSNSHIMVADYNNACLHILDQDGRFLSCVDGLDQPNGMSLDREGRLWVGVASSGDVKVIQYIK